MKRFTVRTPLRRVFALGGLTALAVASGSIATADGTAVRDITDRALAEAPAEPTDLADPAASPADVDVDDQVATRLRAAAATAPASAGDGNAEAGTTDQTAASTPAEPTARSVSAPDRGDRTAVAPGWTWRASWYGPGFHGQTTANGETYDQWAMTAAHKTLPFGTELRVTNQANGNSVVVRINDRGPFVAGRDLDLSKAAADALGFAGVATVRVEQL